MGGLSPWHLAIVLAVVLILFGSKKLPDAARGLGRSMRIFKSEIKEMQNDDKTDEQEPQALTQGDQPNAAQFAQPQAQQFQPQTPQQQAVPQQVPQQQAPQQQTPQQQYVDPAAPHDGGQGQRGQ